MITAIVRLRVKQNVIFMGRGMCELLLAIEEKSSIQEASKLTGISYTKAWRMLKILEHETKNKMVISTKGGNQHGSTILTEDGKKLLHTFINIEKKLSAYAQELVDEHFSF